MTKRLLQQLVLASYKENVLNPKSVEEISNHLDRKDLKAYIRALKLMEQQKKVTVVLPKANLYNVSKKNLESLFPEKELRFEEDANLLLGMRVIDNDMVYDVSLKDRLASILDEVQNSQ